MKRLAPSFSALLLVIVLAGAVSSAASRAAAEDYSDATLEAFVSAAIEVSRRIEAWRPSIEAAADDDERETLIEDAKADLARAIKETEGITEDTYYAIYDAARVDETLRGRIDRILRSRRQRRRVAERGTAGR